MADEEIFEINDFSTASDWERFIADLEEILTQWNLMNQNVMTIDDGKIARDYSQQTSIPSPTSDCWSFKPKSNKPSTSSKLFADASKWKQQQDTLKFGKVKFCLQYFCFQRDCSSPAIGHGEPSARDDSSSNTTGNQCYGNNAWQDMNCIDNDWSASGHPLIRYYGLSEFLVLVPLDGETIATEDRARHLIGSASIAMHNLDCQVPFFCQISHLSRRLFMGVGHMSNGFRTYFEMIQFPEVPSTYRYLNELMVLFKKKLYSSFSYNANNLIANREDDESSNIGDSSAISVPKIQISIRFTYILTKWPMEYLLILNNALHNQESILNEWFAYFKKFDPNETIRKPVPINNANANACDPLMQFQLATTWPSVAEELITDNSYHSDLQPMNAPRWSLRALFYEDYSRAGSTSSNPYCRTVELLRIFCSLKFHQNCSLLSYLSTSNSTNESTNEIDLRSAFDRLSGSVVASPVRFTMTSQLISSVSNLVNQAVSATGHIPNEHLEAIMNNVFHSPASDQKQDVAECLEQLKQLKSSPYDSLSWRISNLCANFYGEICHLTALAQLWKCFVNELRAHWQSGRLLPNFPSENVNSVDHSNCLFHQKLEMLNCCIAQKIKRENFNSQQDKQTNQKTFADSDEEDDEEEFFDAEDIEQQESLKAEGQSHPLTDAQGQPVYLLSKSGQQQIQVPLTQDPAPMTEDALLKQVQCLSQIDDPKLRIRLQSAGLLSDMEAFKAANPGCQFEDFIRWHSPRDWIEKTNESALGQTEFGLSRRMQESATWKELWELAKACPVRRQKRLFNYTKEAEEILQYLQSVTPDELMRLMNPIVAKSVSIELLKHRQQIGDVIQANVASSKTLYDDLFSLDMSNVEQLFAQNDFYKLYQLLSKLELQLVKFYSVWHKLEHSYQQLTNNRQSHKPLQDIIKRTNNQTEQSTNSPANVENSTKKSTSEKLTGKRLRPASSMSNANALTGEQFIRFIVDLLHQPEVEFSNTSIWAALIVQIYSDSDRFQYEQNTSVGERLPMADDNQQSTKHKYRQASSLPSPTGKEFIIRAPSISRPAPYSRASSHRMYCLLSKDFRIASAFTEDTAYF